MRFFSSPSEPEPLEPCEGDSERGTGAAALGAGAFFFGGADFASSSSNAASPAILRLGLVTPDLERVPWRLEPPAENGDDARTSRVRSSHSGAVVIPPPTASFNQCHRLSRTTRRRNTACVGPKGPAHQRA